VKQNKGLFVVVCLLSIMLLGMESGFTSNSARLLAATSPAENANQVWAKKYSDFLGEVSSIKTRNSKYDERPSVLLTLSKVIDCVEEPVFFEIHFTETGRFATQFRVGEDFAPKSVRKINDSFRKSEHGSKAEIESAKVLRAQYYLSRIAALVDDGEKAMRRAQKYRTELSRLCTDDELITAFIDRVKPQVAPQMREVPKIDDTNDE